MRPPCLLPATWCAEGSFTLTLSESPCVHYIVGLVNKQKKIVPGDRPPEESVAVCGPVVCSQLGWGFNPRLTLIYSSYITYLQKNGLTSVHQ